MNIAARTASWLPYDAEVEYLRSDGNAYIDTGILISSNLSVYNECYCESRTSFNDSGYFDNTQGSTIRFYRYFPFAGGISDVQFYCGTSMNITQRSLTANAWHSILTDVKNKVLKLDGNTLDYSYVTSFTGKANLALFALVQLLSGDMNYLVQNIARERVFKIWENNILVRDYIPVRKGSAGFMYDKVSGKLFGNSASSGAFIIGPDIT